MDPAAKEAQRAREEEARARRLAAHISKEVCCSWQKAQQWMAPQHPEPKPDCNSVRHLDQRPSVGRGLTRDARFCGEHWCGLGGTGGG